MSSALSDVPLPRRRRLGAVLTIFAALFLAAGLTATTGSVPGAVRILAVIASAVGLLLGLMSWGVWHSIRLDRAAAQRLRADAELDAAIEQAVRASGAQLCDCGHTHDPDELHVTDDPCAHDGSGADCTHSCETCVLQSLRR